jgi:hypothetical protein
MFHLDGYYQLPYLTGEVDESPRHEFFYYGEHNLFAIRRNNWKVNAHTNIAQCRTRSLRHPAPCDARSGSAEAAVVVDVVALGREEWRLNRSVAAVQAAVRGNDSPPRQIGRPAQDVRHRLSSPGSADFLRDLAVRCELAGHEGAHDFDHRALERRRLVIIRPGSRIRG